MNVLHSPSRLAVLCCAVALLLGCARTAPRPSSAPVPAVAPAAPAASDLDGAGPQPQRSAVRVAPGTPAPLARLARAYPGRIAAADPDGLTWADGTRMAWADGPAPRTPAELFAAPRLADQMAQAYPAGEPTAPPPPGQDPGRVRCDAFFRHLYGGGEAEVRARLAAVPWPAGGPGATLLVTTVNGVDRRLAAAARELAALPEPLRRTWLAHPAGAFYWRTIAGTDRLSMHSFGIAVDLDARACDYWRWDHPRAGEADTVPYANHVPWAIVEIFERHGFIWGGKWHHYDTMHFEYRPELLPEGGD